MKLSIIIVSWNVQGYLLNCLESIKEHPCSEEFEVIVVDNASNDGTTEAVENGFPDITIIANTENLGFGAANNQGIKISKGQYILFLNPDTIIHKDSLDMLIAFLDNNDDIGICGPQLLYEDGTVQPSARCFPDFLSALDRHTIFRSFKIFWKQHKKYMMFDFDFDKQMDVDQIMGAALITRRSIIEQLGEFDERFYMYYEEVDFCYRVKKAGWRIVFTPDTVITHLAGRSSSQIPIENRIMFMTSLLRFFRKHRGKRTTAMFNIIFKPTLILRDIYKLIDAVLSCISAAIIFKQQRLQKAAKKVKKLSIFLGKYSWYIVFKM